MSYTINEMDTLIRAIRYAEKKHRGQTRKDAAASPYIGHPLAVMEMLWSAGEVRDVVVLAAAVLHDTIEDTAATPGEIEELFGAEILAIVQELTDDKDLSKEERKRLQVEHAPDKSPAAAQIKIVDKTVNIRDIVDTPPDDWPLERKQAYVQWGIDVVKRLPKPNPKLVTEFEAVIARARTKLNMQDG